MTDLHLSILVCFAIFWQLYKNVHLLTDNLTFSAEDGQRIMCKVGNAILANLMATTCSPVVRFVLLVRFPSLSWRSSRLLK